MNMVFPHGVLCEENATPTLWEGALIS